MVTPSSLLFVGSPFNCKIGGVQSTKEESVSTRTVKTVETTHVGSVCELALKVPGLSAYFVYLALYPFINFILEVWSCVSALNWTCEGITLNNTIGVLQKCPRDWCETGEILKICLKEMFEYFMCVFSRLINMTHSIHLGKMIIPNYICKTIDIVYTINNRLISMLGFNTFNGIEGAQTKFMLSWTLFLYTSVFMQSFLDHVSAWL